MVITMILSSKWLHSDHTGAEAFRKALGIVSPPIRHERVDDEEGRSEYERLMYQRWGALDRS